MGEASGQDEIHFKPPDQPAGGAKARRFSYAAREPSSQKGEAQRYRRRIAVFRLVLPLAALALCLAILFAPQLKPLRDIFSQGGALLDIDDEGVALVSAHFRGNDENDRPYRLTAEEVHERPDTEEQYDLVNPQGDLTMSDGAWLTLGADKGVYDRTADRLSLFGAVSLFHDQGYELHTEQAEIDLEVNTAWGDSPVTGQAGFGDIVSQGFRFEDGGQRIIFTGEAELRLYPDAEGFPQ